MSQFATNGTQSHPTSGHTVTPEMLAERAGMKRTGKEWHGPNPSGNGATKDGYVLNEDGTSYDRKSGMRYNSIGTAKLHGIDPDDYEPVANHRASNGHATPTSKVKPASVTKKATPKAAKPKLTKTQFFDYHDENGNVIYQVERREYAGGSKDFLQRRPDGNGGWIYDMDGVERVLYRQSEVEEAHTVLIVEGEKVADRINADLQRDGLAPAVVATTASGGAAAKWLDSYNEVLKGKEIIVLPDNDEPGRKHAAKACAAVAPVAQRVQVLTLPDLTEKDDAVDWLDGGGGTLDELLELAKAAPDWMPAPEPTEAEAPEPTEAEAPEAPASARKIVIYDATGILEMPPMVPIVEDFLFADTLAEMVGGAGSFKSFQALGIAEAVAGGHDWQGRKTKRMPTLCITPEGASGLRKRVKALQIAKQRPCQARFILQAVQMHRPDDVDALLFAIAELPEVPGLIIIDTLARCFVGGDENSAKDAGLFIDGLDRIRTATGATVLVVHHVGKSGDARGSSAFPGAFDTIIEAKRHDTIITLKNSKQKDDDESGALSLVRRVVELGETDAMGRPITSLVFDPTDAPPPQAPEGADATREKMLQVLVDLGSVATATTWRDKCETSGVAGRSRFYALSKELEQDAKVTKTGNVYRLVSNPSN